MNLKPKYIKSEAQRDAFVCLIIFAPLCSLVTLYEKDAIAQNLLSLYLVLKISTIFFTSLFLYLASLRPYNQYYIFFATVGAVLYATSSEYFSPLYYYAYVMSMLAISILLRPKLITLAPALFFGSAPILYIQYLKSTGVITHAREPIIMDYVMISLEFGIIVFAIFEGFSKKRRREIQFREKFSIIGQDLNTFAHNIKSMLSSQFMINQNLKTGAQNNQCLKELLEIQEENLKDIHEYLNNFNLLTHSSLESVSVDQSVKKMLKLVDIPNHLATLEIGEEYHVSLIKQDLETILLNTFSNAKKAMKGSESKLDIKLSNNKLTVQYPFIEDYAKSSGIGESISRNLATKNNICFDTDIAEERYITTLTF